MTCQTPTIGVLLEERVTAAMSTLVVDRKTMRSMDALTCKKENITSLELMMRAGRRLFERLEREGYFPPRRPVAILAGCGNNGGDALVIARELKRREIACDVFLIGSPELASEETRSVLKGLRDVQIVQSAEEVARCLSKLERAGLVVDGIFGIGLSKDVGGIARQLIEGLNRLSATLVSIDIPSGLDADSGWVRGCAVNADLTLAVQCLKQGHLLNDGLDMSGRLVTVDVGIEALEDSDAAVKVDAVPNSPLFSSRRRNSHKYDYGSILVVGGTCGMQGAPQLSARAALRTGSGLVTWASRTAPERLRMLYPEMMTLFYDEKTDFKALCTKFDAVVFGPGLASANALDTTFLKTLDTARLPLVVDAGGLCLVDALDDDHGDSSLRVITPHMGEFSRLIGVSVKRIEEDIVGHVRTFMQRFNGVMVLKGPSTIVASRKGLMFVDNGSPALATAGTGDVLAGVIAAFLGVGTPPLEAAMCGVMVHARAGALAETTFGENGVLAGDIIERLPAVVGTLKDEKR